MIMTRFKKCGVTDFRKTFRGLKKSRRRNKNRLTNNFDSIGGEKADDLFLKNVKVFYWIFLPYLYDMEKAFSIPMLPDKK